MIGTPVMKELMSFLGGISAIMENRFAETMETLYALYALLSVVRMLNGKAYARASRCHFLDIILADLT